MFQYAGFLDQSITQVVLVGGSVAIVQFICCYSFALL